MLGAINYTQLRFARNELVFAEIRDIQGDLQAFVFPMYKYGELVGNRLVLNSILNFANGFFLARPSVDIYFAISRQQ